MNVSFECSIAKNKTKIKIKIHSASFSSSHPFHPVRVLFYATLADVHLGGVDAAWLWKMGGSASELDHCLQCAIIVLNGKLLLYSSCAFGTWAFTGGLPDLYTTLVLQS